MDNIILKLVVQLMLVQELFLQYQLMEAKQWVLGLRVLSTEATSVKLRPTGSVQEFSSQTAVSGINESDNMSVPALFTVQGKPNTNNKVSLLDNSIVIKTTANGSNKTMNVNNFKKKHIILINRFLQKK